MNKKNRTFIIFLVVILLITYITTSFITKKEHFVATNIELPRYYADEIFVQHENYSLVYDNSVEQAKWVAYQLKASELIPNYKRTNMFSFDEMVYGGTSNHSDYKGSGYDRGHLAPAADMTWDKIAMLESFYYSNMSPQLPSFNRGIWKKLENYVRHLTTTYDSVYVVSGPVFNSDTLKYIGNNVGIPDYYYKGLVVYNDSIFEGIGFILKHEKSDNEVLSFVVTLDSLESFIKTDLFFNLPDSIENKLEEDYNIETWVVK